MFSAQDWEYQSSVLSKDVPVLAVEAGNPLSLLPFTQNKDHLFGITHFGESAPAQDLFSFFGFTPEKLAQKAKKILKK